MGSIEFDASIRLRPVRQWEAPKDPLKDWEKYGFYPEIEETPLSKPETAILRASLEEPAQPPLQCRIDEHGRRYVELRPLINVPIYTGVHTEELRRGSVTYLLCVHDMEWLWSFPPSFYMSYSKVHVGLRLGGRVYHGQKIARVTLHRHCLTSDRYFKVKGDEFLEFMTSKLSYE